MGNTQLLNTLVRATTKSTPADYVTRKVEEIGSVTYVGSAELNTPDSGAWSIRKITDGAICLIEYARGSWDDRLTLIYQ